MKYKSYLYLHICNFMLSYTQTLSVTDGRLVTPCLVVDSVRIMRNGLFHIILRCIYQNKTAWGILERSDVNNMSN